MRKIRSFIVLALIVLVATNLGCASNRSEAARTADLQEPPSSTPEGFTGVYLGPDERIPDDIAPAPKQVAPKQAAPKQVAPEQASPEQASPQIKKKNPQKASREQALPVSSVEAKNCYSLFRQAYGEALIGKMQKSAKGTPIIIVKGKEIPLVGGKLNDLIYSTDLAKTLSQPYPLEPTRPATPDGVRPGRIRNYNFLEAVYGATQGEVRKQIVSVNFCGKQVPFSKNAGAAAALQRVSAQLEKILAKKPELRKYCVSDGGFYWRKIAGTQYISPHSYGIAIDLCTKYATYWRWEKNPHAPHPQQKNYPPEIVKAFEDNGFVWGGKWHEFDIMHFEYRPEIILMSKMSKNKK